MSLLRLLRRNLLRHPLRSFLTIASLAVALFLLCLLRSLVTTLDSGLAAADPRRMVVQSAVSLFVDLPLSYQARIEQVPGVLRTSKWQWFGAYYREEQNQFSQFAVDPEVMLDFFPTEMEVVEGSKEAWQKNLTGCLIGGPLARQFDWKIGDRIPLIGMIFPHPKGHDVPWEFEVEAIFEPRKRNVSGHMMFFHWDYFERTLEGRGFPPGVSTYYVQLDPQAEPTAVMAEIDEFYEHGPQRVQATPEAEFQAQFVSMFGNVTFFLAAIGSGVLAAILLAAINTMLMAARDQTRDVGVLKALGFSDGSMALLLVSQSVVLCALGGGLGVLLALMSQEGIAEGMGAMFPGYAVDPATAVGGFLLALLIGLVAGAFPAWRAARLTCTEALASRE